jgi:hypothetical protein
MKLRNALGAVIAALVCFICASDARAQSVTYEVGPGKPYTSIGAVPWESLQAGDTVLIHWRSTPYKEKWVISRQGTSSAPITVRGVPGPGGELPVVDGAGATTRLALDFWSETRGVIKIGGSSIPADVTPRYITIENLDIRGARTPNTFTDDGGSTQSYSANASAIFVEKGENITVRNCVIHDCGNGFFVASSDSLASRDILVEGCHIYDNGNSGSIFEHNNYTAAIGITFQYNYFGALRSGAGGNNLKDRSAGLVVRYNWIEGGNRQLDLVDGEDSSLIRSDPRYRQTHVYGNVLVEPNGAGNRQICHYGGDSGTTANYRKGTLFFYNNTIVSYRTDRTTLFRLSTNSERSDTRNNIVYTAAAAGSTLSLIDDTGIVDLSHNWFKPGWIVAVVTPTGTVNDDHTSITGSSPGFVDEPGQNFALASTSACVDAATVLHASVLPTHDLLRQYVKHRASEPRPDDGVLDVGAYEFGSAQPADLAVTTTSLPNGSLATAYSATLAATGGTTPYAWSVASGSLPPGLSLNAQTGAIAGTPTTAGTYAFTAAVTDSQSPADSDTQALSITVGKRPTSTALALSPSTSVWGQTVTMTATVSVLPPATGAATGTVRFFNGTTQLGTATISNGVATFTKSNFGVGTYSITAQYDGNASTAGSTSPARSLVVNMRQTSTALSLSATSTVFRQPVTMTATVSVVAPGTGTPTGTVRFYDGTTLLGSATLSNGVATFTKSNFSVGSHSVTATYVGIATAATSTSAAVALTVAKGQTTTTLTASPAPQASVGTPVTYTATVTAQSPSSGQVNGTMQFYDGATLVATRSLAGNAATFTVTYASPGTHQIRAVYSGALNFLTSQSPIVTETIVP